MRIKTKLSLCLIVLSFASINVDAGNKDRAAQAGATELLINPWARSTGWWGANSANVRGLEAMRSNVGGLAFTTKTELALARTSWWSNPFNKSAVNADISINAFGLAQRVGESGVLGFSVMTMSFGDIQITTVDQPEGGLGTFSPQFANIGMSYAKEFSNSIYGGATLRMVSESIADVSAQGIALDAGVQYVAGAYDQIKFGIALRNVGPTLRYAGDGLSFRGIVPANELKLTVEQRSEKFELPSLLNIGGAYDFLIADRDSLGKIIGDVDHRVTIAGTFTSNSFTQDQIRLGVEYGFKKFFMIRVGYNYEQDILSSADRLSAYTGPSAGFTFEVPFGEGGTALGIDYSYRAASPFQGTHTFGVRISM
ncbi:PorV/PorQ family protein [bacterium AH-315-C07]|nr:PorV/PorQ family protein [bacterium AH-315-C07]